MSTKRNLLFVEDWPRPYQPMLTAIEEEFDLRVANSVDEALVLLRSNVKEQFDGVLIDARLRGPIPLELRAYGANSSARRRPNGQFLGAWIRENLEHVPYAYITLIPGYIDLSFEKAHPNFKGVIDKESDDVLPKLINATIRRVLNFT